MLYYDTTTYYSQYNECMYVLHACGDTTKCYDRPDFWSYVANTILDFIRSNVQILPAVMCTCCNKPFQ